MLITSFARLQLNSNFNLSISYISVVIVKYYNFNGMDISDKINTNVGKEDQ